MLQPLKVSCYKSFTDQGHLDLTKEQHEVPEKNRKTWPQHHVLPVVPHKAVAEVSKIGNL